MTRRRLPTAALSLALASILAAGALAAGTLAAGGLAGCTRGRAARAPTPPTRAKPTTPAFQAMRAVLDEGAVARGRNDPAALRALSPRLANTALALLKARPPHDLKRAHVARYQDGRAEFGGAVKQWVGAVESEDDAAILQAFDQVTDAYWGWVDASKGLAPARAV